MTRLRLFLLVVIWPICAGPVQAQLFRRKPAPPPPPPAQRVPELVSILKSAPEERKRTSAAEELREFDPQAYAEILPALIEAARNDAKVGVRMEAVTALSKIRPITREAGQAIEHSASEDSNLRARIHARTTLWRYQLAGYSSKSPSAAARKTTEEPPLIDSPTLLGPMEVKPGTTVQVSPATPPGPDVPRPLPTGPSFSTAVPQRPRITPRPASETTIIEDDLPPLPPSTAPVPPAPSEPPAVSSPPAVAEPPLTGPALPAFPDVPPSGPILLPEPPPVIVPLP